MGIAMYLTPKERKAHDSHIRSIVGEDLQSLLEGIEIMPLQQAYNGTVKTAKMF
jgi:hypothetical protein